MRTPLSIVCDVTPLMLLVFWPPWASLTLAQVPGGMSNVLGKTVAMSTCEAEVNAAVSASKDALHLNRMLAELGYSNGKPLQIAEDNAACIAQAETGLRHVRNARHYAVRLRFLQELVLNKEVAFKYCPTNYQLADIFTKSLDKDKFVQFRDAILGPMP